MQIDMMATIYKGSVAGFVLDRELLDTPRSSTNGHKLSIEHRLRLACSVWMCRSWTLQEGQLPPRLAVQFSDFAAILGPRDESAPYSYTESLVLTRHLHLFRSSNAIARSTETTPLLGHNVGVASEAGSTSPVGQMKYSASSDSSNGSQVSRLQSFSDAAYQIICDLMPRIRHCSSCVGYALENHFATTFFTPRIDLTTVWNELAGRSTTKTEDLPFIITNILDLDARALFRLRDVREMFRAILLSLTQVPLSLFLNTGARYATHAGVDEAWLPTGIGDFVLQSGGLLDVKSSHFLYRCRGVESPETSKTRIYVTDDILLHRDNMILSLDEPYRNLCYVDN